MATIVRAVPLENFIPDPTYVLKRVSPKYVYRDKERTDEIEGFTYALSNCSSHDWITVTVKQKAPVVTQEEVDDAKEARENIIVEVVGATVTPYYSERTHSVEDSIKATNLRLVTTE